MLALHFQIIILTVVQNGHSGGWRDSSASRQVYCSCRGPEYSSQYPHWEAQNHLSSNARDSVDLFGRGYLHSHVPVRMYSHVHTHTHVHIQRSSGYKRRNVIITFGYLCICLFVYLLLVQGVRPRASICLFEWRDNAREGTVLGSYPQLMKPPRPSCHGL